MLEPRHMMGEPDPDGSLEEDAATIEEINRLYELVCDGLQKLIVQLDEYEDTPAHDQYKGSASAAMTLHLERLENTELPK
jgi:hypothetical protein